MTEKRLVRSQDRMFLGVCGGLARYFNIDPTLVRLLYVFLSLGSFGTGLLIYVLLAVLMPDDNYVGSVEHFDPEEEVVIKS